MGHYSNYQKPPNVVFRPKRDYANHSRLPDTAAVSTVGGVSAADQVQYLKLHGRATHSVRYRRHTLFCALRLPFHLQYVEPHWFF